MQIYSYKCTIHSRAAYIFQHNIFTYISTQGISCIMHRYTNVYNIEYHHRLPSYWVFPIYFNTDIYTCISCIMHTYTNVYNIEYHHILPSYWVLIRFCLRPDQNESDLSSTDQIPREWKKVSLRKFLSRTFLRFFLGFFFSKSSETYAKKNTSKSEQKNIVFSPVIFWFWLHMA